jgi:hypothetical protein
MKSRLCSSIRCDDLIGFWVTFEKKAKTMESCWKHPIEIIDSNDSTSFSVHPAYIRHKHAAQRAYRGRSRFSTHDKCFDDRAKHRIDQKWNVADTTPDDDFSSGQSARESEKSSLTVVALEEVVEVIIDTTEGEKSGQMKSSECAVAPNFPETFDNAQKHGSTSSAPKSIKEASWKVNYKTKIEETEDDVSSAFAIPFQNSQKLNDLLNKNDNPSGRCKFKQTHVQDKHQTVCELTTLQTELSEKENKNAAVAFRDPISEMIPTRHGLISSEQMTLVIGDLVDIQNGTYHNKTGRVIRVFENLVLVAIVGEFIKPLYLSPSLLGLTNVNHIRVIY